MENKAIIVYNLGNLPTADVDEFLDLQEDFKIYDPELNKKLQNLILTRGFKYAFLTWVDPEGKKWIIDAHQRKRALQELRKAGYKIPLIPYQPIQAKDKREAVEEIAALNSDFAIKNPDTLLFEKYNITVEDLGGLSISILCGWNWERKVWIPTLHPIRRFIRTTTRNRRKSKPISS